MENQDLKINLTIQEIGQKQICHNKT